MGIFSPSLIEETKTVLEWLTVAGLFLLLFLSHVLKLTRWGCEEYEDFRRWWEAYKNRRGQ